MVGLKLSAGAQLKIDVLTQARRKFDRLHALVEQYAGTSKGEDSFLSPISRTATEVGRLFMQNGYGIMADHSNQIGMLAKRGVGKQTKLRAFRELMVSVRAALDHAEKMIIEEEKAAHSAPPDG
ncbi:MAG: hypothetical protein HYW52_12215 [Gemmatimonadetes bacterium]|nr:hypothetical protein [Gemmatimonadota bacterium]MBI2402470.1 hypothetical protein [Gemmatimonadota bacterium]MBI2616418.1 hypothetical protein [Gemmatimonadota bacterium]